MIGRDTVLYGVKRVFRSGMRIPAVSLVVAACLVFGGIPSIAAADSRPTAALSIDDGITPLSSSPGGGGVTIEVRGADIRDVLSALALKMGSSVILAADPVKVNFKAEGVTARRALELLVQREGLSYIQDGNIIVVGKQEDLDKNFFAQMHLTRFDLVYIPAEKVKSLIGQLGIPAKAVTVETHPGILWAQGSAQALQKVRELVNAVDIPGVDVSGKPATQSVFVYQLKNIVARDAAERLGTFISEESGPADAADSLLSSLAGTAGATGASSGAGVSASSGGSMVKTITFSYPEFGRELLVICPSHMETQVRGALNRLDQERAKVRIPVAKSDNYQLIYNYRKLLSDLTGIPTSSFNISSDLMPGEKDEYVMWVEESPDNVKRVADYLQLIGSAQPITVQEEEQVQE